MTAIQTDLSQLKCWPVNGFAPGGYTIPKCCDCSKDFIAAKRSYRCLECAIKNIVKRVEKSESDVQGMAQELLVMDSFVANPKERIIAAAVYHGCTFSLPPPASHGHILATIHASLGVEAMAKALDLDMAVVMMPALRQYYSEDVIAALRDTFASAETETERQILAIARECMNVSQPLSYETRQRLKEIFAANKPASF